MRLPFTHSFLSSSFTIIQSIYLACEWYVTYLFLFISIFLFVTLAPCLALVIKAFHILDIVFLFRHSYLVLLLVFFFYFVFLPMESFFLWGSVLKFFIIQYYYQSYSIISLLYIITLYFYCLLLLVFPHFWDVEWKYYLHIKTKLNWNDISFPSSNHCLSHRSFNQLIFINIYKYIH